LFDFQTKKPDFSKKTPPPYRVVVVTPEIAENNSTSEELAQRQHTLLMVIRFISMRKMENREERRVEARSLKSLKK
jgi:hypothetical protein